jgi:NADH-quinone oxidoreductase subunit A
LVIGTLVGIIVAVMYFLGAWLGPKVRTTVKQEPFECGQAPFETPGRPFGVKFYLIAILFVIFDIDLAFLFPWAVVFRDIGIAAFFSMVVFIGILALTLWYVWKKGALQWE